MMTNTWFRTSDRLVHRYTPAPPVGTFRQGVCQRYLLTARVYRAGAYSYPAYKEEGDDSDMPGITCLVCLAGEGGG